MHGLTRRMVLLAPLAGAACSWRWSAGKATAIRGATWNLRLNTESDGPDAWPLRRHEALALIQRLDLDLLATQEGLIDQIRDLETLPGYERVGVGRDDGKAEGEHAAIFFRSARFERIASGDFWLSETPEVPSRGWDGRCCRRLCSWVTLRERASGRVFSAFSAHFDHEGAVARRESAKLILVKMRAIAGTHPAVLLADLNATPESEPVGLLLAGGLRDAYRVSRTAPEGPVGTFNGFRLDAPLTDRIDYLLLQGSGWQVQRYQAIAARRANGRYPSDHLPVLALLVLE